MLSPWLPALLSSAAGPLQVCFSSTLQEVELYRHIGVGTATQGETGPAQAPRLVNQWHRWRPVGRTQHLQRLLSLESAVWLPMLVPVLACMQQLKWSVTACCRPSQCTA